MDFTNTEGQKKIFVQSCVIFLTISLFSRERCIILHLAWRLERMDNDSLGNLCYEMEGCAKRRGPGYELFSGILQG
jgi:hypothetical protein